MQRNKALISGRDGENQQLNLVECIGSSGASAASLCGNKSAFTVSTVDTVAGSSNVKEPCII